MVINVQDTNYSNRGMDTNTENTNYCIDFDFNFLTM